MHLQVVLAEFTVKLFMHVMWQKSIAIHLCGDSIWRIGFDCLVCFSTSQFKLRAQAGCCLSHVHAAGVERMGFLALRHRSPVAEVSSQHASCDSAATAEMNLQLTSVHRMGVIFAATFARRTTVEIVRG